MNILSKFYNGIKFNQEGASAIEYALIILLVALVIISTVAILGGHVLGLLEFEWPSQ